ncbi:Uncharacterised protein [Vibrio cholerae]|nr:Uncharacterised protein [Vibrio cholerae]
MSERLIPVYLSFLIEAEIMCGSRGFTPIALSIDAHGDQLTACLLATPVCWGIEVAIARNKLRPMDSWSA